MWPSHLHFASTSSKGIVKHQEKPVAQVLSALSLAEVVANVTQPVSKPAQRAQTAEKTTWNAAIKVALGKFAGPNHPLAMSLLVMSVKSTLAIRRKAVKTTSDVYKYSKERPMASVPQTAPKTLTVPLTPSPMGLKSPPLATPKVVSVSSHVTSLVKNVLMAQSVSVDKSVVPKRSHPFPISRGFSSSLPTIKLLRNTIAHLTDMSVLNVSFNKCRNRQATVQ